VARKGEREREREREREDARESPKQLKNKKCPKRVESVGEKKRPPTHTHTHTHTKQSFTAA
jgi:hypothetical protein